MKVAVSATGRSLAGILAAHQLAHKDVRAVLTGSCGPNAHQTLSGAGIDVFVGSRGTVADVVASYKSGKLHPTGVATVESHPGKGR